LLASAVFPLIAASLVNGLGSLGLFAVIAGMYVVMAVTALFGPETKGVPLEQVSGRHVAATVGSAR
ncbi:hypothetical protein ACFQ07_29510, partial [Actinomadura adrarensis]